MAEKSDEARRWGERLQSDLMASMDAEWNRAKDSDDVAVVALADKRARMFGTFARSAKAVVAMISEAKQPAASGDEDEADMHGEIPDDPEELRTAVESKVARFAELLERKRIDGAGGGLDDDDAGGAATVSQRRSG
jgi:hypothetical protein